MREELVKKNTGKIQDKYDKSMDGSKEEDILLNERMLAFKDAHIAAIQRIFKLPMYIKPHTTDHEKNLQISEMNKCMANLNNMNWQYSTVEKNGKKIILDDSSCILIRKMELVFTNPHIPADQKEQYVVLLDGHGAVISDDGQKLFLDMNGQKHELLRTIKNDRGNRIRP